MFFKTEHFTAKYINTQNENVITFLDEEDKCQPDLTLHIIGKTDNDIRHFSKSTLNSRYVYDLSCDNIIT